MPFTITGRVTNLKNSGPKRYDYDAARGVWFYSRDGGTLHHLLETEVSGMLGVPVDLARRRDEHNS